MTSSWVVVDLPHCDTNSAIVVEKTWPLMDFYSTQLVLWECGMV
jgi:hypothetical protein